MGVFDKIKNAKFINESTTIQSDLEELRALLEIASGNDKVMIEQAIKNLEYGKKGEEAIRKESKNMLLKHFFEKNFENNYIPVVVMVNQSGKIDVRNAPEDIKNKIIGVDQLIRFIKNSNTSKEQVSEKVMESTAEFFLEKGSENPRNYMHKYRKFMLFDEEEDLTQNNIPAGRVKNAKVEETMGENKFEKSYFSSLYLCRSVTNIYYPRAELEIQLRFLS